MTSKELNEIFNKTRRTPNICLTPEQVEEIVKDLEILEILKQLAKGVINLKEKNIDITKYVVLISESTNEKVKNWLERKE